MAPGGPHATSRPPPDPAGPAGRPGRMKFALFTPHGYAQPADRAGHGGWPGSPALFDPAAALRSHERMLELCRLADETGFDWLSLAEHHYSQHLMAPSPLLLAAELAPRLARARLAILGTVIPLANPVRVAEELALLDVITGGRLAMAGFFRGTPNEYLTYGTPAAHSREMYEEGVELVVRAWTTPVPFGWEGRHFRHRLISVWPRPVQQPHPPVLVSGNSPDSGGFAARNRFSIGLAFMPAPAAARAAGHYRAAAQAAGWQAGPENIIYRLFAYVAPTDEEARRDCETYRFRFGSLAAQGRGFSRYAAALADVGQRYGGRPAAPARSGAAPSPPPGPPSGPPPDPGTGPGGVPLLPPLCGSPETVLRQVRELSETTGAGVLDLILYTDALPHELALRSVELFGTEVIPRAREL
jgi:alkanesulfonate monooxygenase SsuD/methylene tetrahydromethanopterin reductase-like flavin-dependent oxidoreductase (luciferase family)